MFIIAHRGGAGLAPENTIEAIEAGIAAGADMIEIDVRLSKDRVPILLHDASLWRTHRWPKLAGRLTYKTMLRRTKDSANPIASLDTVLNKFAGKILFNIEIKDRKAAKDIIKVIEKYVKEPHGWEAYLISSFMISELKTVRKLIPEAQLALLDWSASLRFIRADAALGLTAVGFHRLYTPRFAILAAKNLKLFTYAFTVNRPEAAKRLLESGIDGIVSDMPDRMRAYEEKHPELSN